VKQSGTFRSCSCGLASKSGDWGRKVKKGEGAHPPPDLAGGKQDFQVERWKSAQSCSAAKDGDTPFLPLAVALWGEGAGPLIPRPEENKVPRLRGSIYDTKAFTHRLTVTTALFGGAFRFACFLFVSADLGRHEQPYGWKGH